MTKNINIYFVLPSQYDNELETREEMQQAYELCRQNQIIPEWIREENCLSKNFDKTDIVVFEKFESITFENVKTRLVVGPWCIITCLLEGIQVPSNNSPIYNMAMYNLSVTASHYPAEEKKKIKDKVEMMGGTFSVHITSSTTHLITNSVTTRKCVVANSKGIPVMLESWVEDVWECSLSRNVKATDDEFQKHKCPCFKNLRICATGFEISERNKLQKLMTENGGLFSGKMLTANTDILICKPGIKSDKYEVAKRAKIPCVRIEWMTDSIEKGFALPEEPYIVQCASSTPTKGDAPLNPDFSMMSVIVGNETSDHFKTSASDTINVSLFNIATPQRTIQKENQEPDIVAEIDLQAVRKAGAFLDGCGVYLAGFSPGCREKLCRILRSAGATRYDAISDRVTQVIVGDPTSHEVRLLGNNVPLVSPAWLNECIRRGQPAPEDPFIVHIGAQTATVHAPSSPLSKKGLTLLQNDISMAAEPESSKQPEPELEEHASVQIYKNNKMNSEEDTLAQFLVQGNINSKYETKSVRIPSNETIEEDEKLIAIFESKTFKVIDHLEEEELKKLTETIEELGGKVMENNYRGVIDFAVMPLISGAIRQTATEIVNSLWILDCHTQNKLLTPQYYHQPLIVASNAEPLKDCVITISGYIGYERTFLIKVIQNLGAIYQDKFAKTLTKNVLASTHLVCRETTGNKFIAAQKWKKHIVTHVWLLRCAETGQWLPEQNFLRTDNDSGESIVAPTTPTLTSNKRDFEGKPINTENKKVSPPAVPIAQVTPSPLNNKRDYEGKIIKQKTEVANNMIQMDNNKMNDERLGDNPMITVEDGRTIPLVNYMDELRAQGVFDTPSPIPPAASGTPVLELLARLRREGKIPSSPSGKTPTRGNSTEFGGASQGTPVGRYLRGLQERNVLPASPKPAGSGAAAEAPIPRPFFDVKTPDTPLGRFLGEDNPSPSTRKHFQRYLDRLPHNPTLERAADPPRRPSTPWSEVKRQAWTWLFRDKDGNDSVAGELSVGASEPPAEPPGATESQLAVSNQIDQLQDMLRRRESSGPSRSLLLALDGQGASTSSDPIPSATEAKDSQTDTVGWDEPLEDCVFSESTGLVSERRKFMISSIERGDSRINICNIIRSLGGEVSALNCFDPTATHVVCSSVTRNEKILSSMAAGLWILHHSYVEQSGAAGRFLPEEKYELGNPIAMANLSSFVESPLGTDTLYWWHERMRRTGKGAFHDMRALVFAKTDGVKRLIEAGGGTVLQASPPFAHSIDITHCFLDPKRQLDYNEFIPLAEQGVPCLNVLYLSNFLCNRTNVNLVESIIPELSSHYN